MRDVFLDTVGLIALWDVRDEWRRAALAGMATLDQPGVRLVTTSLILVECGNAAARKPYREDVCAMRERLRGQGNLIVVTEGDVEEAWAAYRNEGAGGASLVDQISFVVMRRLGIRDVFSNDRHFTAAGFNMLF